VVIGMLDPNPVISGKGQQKLREARIATDFFTSDLMEEVEELNREFKLYGFNYHTRDLRLAKEQRPGAGGVEEAVQCEKGLSGGVCRGEAAVRWKTAVQAPGDEHGLTDTMEMRQAARVEGGHEWRVGELGTDSQPRTVGRFPIGRRFSICPTGSL
jgi:hypothetical protein